MSTTVTYKGSTLTTVENETRTLTTRGKYLEDNITLVDVTSGGEPNLQAKTYAVDGAGTDTVTADSGYDGLSSVEVSVPSAQPLVDSTSGFETVSGARKWFYEPNATAGIMGGYDAGWAEGAYSGRKVSFNAVPSGTTVTPSTTAQTIGGTKHMMEGAVTVNAIPSEYIIPSGNKAITENGTGIDVAQYETVSVNVSGGGGGASSWTKVAETSYQVNATNTSASTVATWETGHSEIWTSNKWVYVRVRDTAGKRNGYFYGSDNFFINRWVVNGAGNTNVDTGIRYTLNYTSQGAYGCSQQTGTTGYGVYADGIYSDGRVRIRQRYHSSNSLTINSTYKVEVYLLDPAGGVPIFG